ncbi:MAG: MazG nucleotide pyrophosphohydrolase domain-containing protein [Nitrospira sp.]
MPDTTPINDINGLNQYQDLAFETAVFPSEIGPLYCAMGALGEAGELVAVLLDYYRLKVSDENTTSDLEAILFCLEQATAACRSVEHMKKQARKGIYTLPQLPDLDEETRARIKSEQGDCLWYQAAAAQVAGHTLAEVCQQNIAKLRERRSAGVLASAGETVEERIAANRSDRNSG